MDRVRFGRALGFGARHAMKTLVTAVDAATSENPSKQGPKARPAASQPRPQAPPQVSTAASSKVTKAAHAAGKTVSKTAGHAREVKQGVRRGGKRFGEAVWGPFVRLSGVLWLEVMGVFFGIFALFALSAAWRLRGEWHLTATNAESHRGFEGAVVMLGVFGYFCVSSFVRAKKRERRR